jgi:hypothetical protein
METTFLVLCPDRLWMSPASLGVEGVADRVAEEVEG